MQQSVFDTRWAMVTNGYTSIIPVTGKVPPLDEWQKVENVSREMLEEWDRDYANATNTGIVTKFVPTLDLDILNEAAALAAEALIREHFNGRGTILVRIGRSPRRAIPFRTTKPFKKRQINFAVTKGAELEKIELLGDGQQFVADGIHPDTQGEYVWLGGDPTKVPYDALPETTEYELHRLQDEITQLLVDKFGYAYSWAANKRRRQQVSDDARTKNAAPKNPKRDLAWATKALEAECEAIAEAVEGNRNNQLNLGAFNVLQIVHGNPELLDEAMVRARLFEAAQACGLVADEGEDSVWATINSAEAGAQSKPRTRPLSKMEQLKAEELTSPSGNGFDLTGTILSAVADPDGNESEAKDEGKADLTVVWPENEEDEDAALPGSGTGAAGQRQLIRLHKGEYHHAADTVEKLLVDTWWCEFYQRGGLMVRAAEERMSAAKDRETSAWRFIAVELTHLLELAERIAMFEVFDRRSMAWVPSNCPDRIGKMVMARQGHWQFPIVLGIVHTPPLRRDGTLTLIPGYDPESWLIFKPDGAVFPPVPDQPTWEEASAALDLLAAPIRKFPCKSEVDRAVMLSLFLTGVCRRVLDFAPMHGMSATAAGTGKSMLVDLCSILLSGRDVPVISINSSREEIEKRIGASLIAGDPIITFDNCNAPVGHPLICQMLSQRWVRVRVLGLSMQVDAPTSALVAATANNLTLEGDLTRRTIRCELDAEMERPELREFDFDPKQEVRQRRGELVTAALTIIRAGRVAEQAGWPDANGVAMKMPTPLGGFAMWSSWVRNTLLWLGCADPCASMEALFEDDPVREMHIALLAAWQTTTGLGINSEFHAQQLIDHTGIHTNTELRAALLAVAREQGSSGSISAKRLGWWLKKVDGKICQGLCIRRSRAFGGHTFWKLVKA